MKIAKDNGKNNVNFKLITIIVIILALVIVGITITLSSNKKITGNETTTTIISNKDNNTNNNNNSSNKDKNEDKETSSNEKTKEDFEEFLSKNNIEIPDNNTINDINIDTLIQHLSLEIDEDGNPIPNKNINIEDIKSEICNSTVKWNKYIDGYLGYMENGFEDPEYDGTRGHIAHLLESFTDSDATDDEYISFESSSLKEVQAYIRYCIYNEEMYAPFGSLCTAYIVLKGFMESNHPIIENIDELYINHLGNSTQIDWAVYNTEFLFRSNNKNYKAIGLLSVDINNEIFIEIYDIKEE